QQQQQQQQQQPQPLNPQAAPVSAGGLHTPQTQHAFPAGQPPELSNGQDAQIAGPSTPHESQGVGSGMAGASASPHLRNLLH
ncbi:hypothetical protein LTS00_002439, partial [Friedmanniomyces endolithicus]